MASTWLNRRHSATLRNPLAEEISSANESLLRFANYSKLRKVALMVVAHKSTSAEIGILRKVFQSYDTNGSGALDYDEFKAAISEVGFKESDYHKVFDAVVSIRFLKARIREFIVQILMIVPHLMLETF